MTMRTAWSLVNRHVFFVIPCANLIYCIKERSSIQRNGKGIKGVSGKFKKRTGQTLDEEGDFSTASEGQDIKGIVGQISRVWY